MERTGSLSYVKQGGIEEINLRDVSEFKPEANSVKKSSLAGWFKAMWALFTAKSDRPSENLHQVGTERAVHYLKNGDAKEFSDWIRLSFYNAPGNSSAEKWGAVTNQLKSALDKTSDKSLLKILNRSPDSWRGCDRPGMKALSEALDTYVRDTDRSCIESDRNTFQDKTAALKESYANDLTVWVDQKSEAQWKYLGGGAKNAVYRMKYQDANANERTGVFKALKENEVEGPISPGTFGGIDRKNPQFLHLAVASSKVCDMFNFGDRYVATKFANVNDQRGIVMDLASGGAPQVTGKKVAKLGSDPSRPTFKKELQLKEDWKLGRINDKGLKGWAAMLGCREIRKGSDGELEMVKAEVKNLDPQNATTRKEITELQLLDIVCGQMDRHPENYYIDGDGHVRGIDNDLAFGTMNDIHQARNQDDKAFMPNRGSLQLNPPKVIDAEMFQKIVGISHENADDPQVVRESINGKKEAMREQLKEHMTPRQLDAAIQRYEQLAQHCLTVRNRERAFDQQNIPQENRDTKFITNPQDWGSERTRELMMNRDTSYMGREMLVLRGEGFKGGVFSAPGKWTHLRQKT